MPNETLLGDSPTTIACITLQSGQPGCRAFFYPSIYKMLLIIGEKKEKIDLGYAGSRLLERLIEFAGDAVDREDLIGYAWPERVVGQGSLNQQIYTLRQILGDEKSRKIIQTLPRRGYLFHPDFVIRTNETLATELIATICEESTAADQSLSTGIIAGDQDLPVNAALTVIDLMDTGSTIDAPHTAINNSSAPTSHIAHSTRRNWRVICALLGASGIALITLLYLSLRPAAASAPVHERIQLGKLNVVYASHHTAELQQLMADTHTLTMRFGELNRTSGTVFWHMAGDYYEALCISNNISGQALMIHQNQLNQITDTQLQQCFPD